jgi:Putative Actinobacterial Holin-X, holin superfamily III
VFNENGKTIAGVINEAMDELKDFLAATIGFLGFVLLSFALVAAIAHAIGWGWSALVVGGFYCMTAGGIGFLAYREIRAEGVTPARTLHVLKMDKIWLENEARTHL